MLIASVKRSISAASRPSMYVIVQRAIGIDTLATKSHSPAVAKSSTIRRTSSAIDARICSMRAGLNAEETRLRSFRWRGASRATMDWVAWRMSSGNSSNCTPLLDI